MTDALTIAYLALAHHQATPAERNAAHRMDDGEMGTIETLTSYADVVDRAYDNLVGDAGWSGVFCYDVVEPVGRFIMSEIASGNTPSRDRVKAKAEALIRKQLDS